MLGWYLLPTETLNKDTPSSQWHYSPNCALASCLPPPQCSVISGQLPVVTVHKSSSILLHHILQSFPGPSNWLYSSKLSFKHFCRNSCAFCPLDVSCPLKPLTRTLTKSNETDKWHNSWWPQDLLHLLVVLYNSKLFIIINYLLYSNIYIY
jgi:hypothetical protein